MTGNASVAAGVLVKLFIGAALTPDVRMQLNQTSGWKELQAGIGGSEHALAVERFQDKEYLGQILETAIVDLETLADAELQVRQTIQEMCPALNIDALQVTVFSLVYMQ